MSPESKPPYDEPPRPPGAAPLARVISLPSAPRQDPPGSASGSQAPPIAPPPLPGTAAAASGPGEARESEEEELPGASRWTFTATFFGMAAAVVAIAAATFGLGRMFWQPPQELGRQSAKADPEGGTNASETNPGEEPSAQTPAAKGKALADAVVVMQEGSQDVHLTPATAVVAGGVTVVPIGGDEVLDFWSSEGDEAAWVFKLLRPGFFQLELTYAALDDAGETEITAFLDEEKVATYTLRPTGDLNRWQTQRHTVAVPSSGRHALVLHLEGPVEAGAFRLRQVSLVAVGSGSSAEK